MGQGREQRTPICTKLKHRRSTFTCQALHHHESLLEFNSSQLLGNTAPGRGRGRARGGLGLFSPPGLRTNLLHHWNMNSPAKELPDAGPLDPHPSSGKADQRDLILGRFWNFSTAEVWGWVSGCWCVLQGIQHTPCLLLARCQKHPPPQLD